MCLGWVSGLFGVIVGLDLENQSCWYGEGVGVNQERGGVGVFEGGWQICFFCYFYMFMGKLLLEGKF